jgi:5-methylcytosine-specific restriction enzyme subunit McrC
MRNVPIQNVYYMLTYAWKNTKEKDIAPSSGEESPELYNFLAQKLIDGIYHLLKRGFNRDYRTQSNDLRTIRGKINFSESVKRGLLNNGRVQCEYDEFDEDTKQNQIIKATLTKLISIDTIENGIRNEIIVLKRRFATVSNIPLVKSSFSGLSYNGNNKYYQYLMNICEFIYQNIIPTEQSGRYKFKKFEEDRLFAIFESFVKKFYEHERPDLMVTGERYAYRMVAKEEETQKYIPTLNTDVSLISKQRKLIIDTKFYKKTLVTNEFGNQIIDSNNLRQINAYLDNAVLEEGQQLDGMLLHPTIDQDYSMEYKYRKKFNVFFQTINLNQDWKFIKNKLLKIINPIGQV